MGRSKIYNGPGDFSNRIGIVRYGLKKTKQSLLGLLKRNDQMLAYYLLQQIYGQYDMIKYMKHIEATLSKKNLTSKDRERIWNQYVVKLNIRNKERQEIAENIKRFKKFKGETNES